MTEADKIYRSGQRDHGGGLDRMIARHGGTRADWLDLSTGINPDPYPIGLIARDAWTALPDRDAHDRLVRAARKVWAVPEEAAVLAAPGASALIARIPALVPPGRVEIASPTYNEHAAAFAAQGWQVVASGPAEAVVRVHPNNPDGRFWTTADIDAPLAIIDESFCDIAPAHSHIALSAQDGRIVLKSFGKFWGLAGLRLGFAMGDPALITRLADLLGPWPVSGPALQIGAEALADTAWADATRATLADSAARLDAMMLARGAILTGGTDLFRLYHVDDAAAWQDRLARARIWTRVFPWSPHALRLGLPPCHGWDRLETAL